MPAALRWRSDHVSLALAASHHHRQRVAGYPALVVGGRLSEQAAATGIRIAGAIAADWGAVAYLAPEPAWIHDGDDRGAWPFERIETLTRLAALTRKAAEAQAWDSGLIDLADATATLLWWETATPRARFYADLNARAVAEAMARPRPPITLGRPAPYQPEPRWVPAHGRPASLITGKAA